MPESVDDRAGDHETGVRCEDDDDFGDLCGLPEAGGSFDAARFEGIIEEDIDSAKVVERCVDDAQQGRFSPLSVVMGNPLEPAPETCSQTTSVVFVVRAVATIFVPSAPNDRAMP